MHRLVTNISAISLDDYRFNSEPDGALEITNEHSGRAAQGFPIFISQISGKHVSGLNLSLEVRYGYSQSSRVYRPHRN